MRGWVLAGLLGFAMTAQAAVLHGDRGTLDTLDAVEAGANSVECDGSSKLSLLLDITAGTATVNPQVSIDNGAHWDDVGSLSGNADGDVIEIEVPNGLYRVEASACSGCTVIVTWKCVTEQ